MNYLFPPFFYSKAFAVPFFYFWVFPLLVWSLGWKGLALWKSARNHQKGWFVALLLINTLGILEILYLALFQKPCCADCCQPIKKSKPRPKKR